MKNIVTGPLSPYALASILSKETGKEVRPQLVYAATRPNDAGVAKLRTTLSETGKQVVSAEDANQYIADHLERQKARDAKAIEATKEATATK